jgi:hypothetical protein
MAPAARPELDPAATCRNCGQALPAGGAVCPRCGAAHGEASRCPHCHAIADVEPHAALGFRCLVCGGPRVALDVQGVAPSARTNAALQGAGQEQTQHLMLSAAGFALGGMGLLALLITSLVVLSTSPSALLVATAYLASAVPLGAGLLALARAARARQLRATALSAARVSALADVQAVTGVLPAERVSAIMRISPERAELLLAEASLASYLNEAPAPRVRVDATDGASAPGAAEHVGSAVTELGEPRAKTLRGDTEI